MANKLIGSQSFSTLVTGSKLDDNELFVIIIESDYHAIFF